MTKRVYCCYKAGNLTLESMGFSLKGILEDLESLSFPQWLHF